MCVQCGVLNFIKQTLSDLKQWIDSNNKIIGDFNIPLYRQMDHPNIQQRNSRVNWHHRLQGSDTYNTLYSTVTEHIFSSAQEHSPGQIWQQTTGHVSASWKLAQMLYNRSPTNARKQNNMLLDDQTVNKRTKVAIENFLKRTKWKYNISKSVGYSKSKGKFIVVTYFKKQEVF